MHSQAFKAPSLKVKVAQTGSRAYVVYKIIPSRKLIMNKVTKTVTRISGSPINTPFLN